MVDDAGNGISPKSHVLPPLCGARIQHPRKRPKACRRRTSISKDPDSSLAQQIVPRCQETTNLNLIPPLQELDTKSSLSVFTRPFCSFSSRAALLETHTRELWFRMSSKNPPVLRHRQPRLNINSGSLPLAAAVVRHLDPRSNERALRLFLRGMKPVLVPILQSVIHSGRPRQTCTQCNECELTVLLPLRCMLRPLRCSRCLVGWKMPNRHGPKRTWPLPRKPAQGQKESLSLAE